MYANFKKKFGGGVIIRNLMMAAAKATYRQLWDEKMMELRSANEAAYTWLMAIPTRTWCKHAFTHYPKCDVLMNNLSESFNATILLARDKPILTMMDWIRTYIMGRFATLNEKFARYSGQVLPKPLKRLSWEVNKSASWLPTQCGEGKYEVKHAVSGEGFTVDLNRHYCSCNFWELVGIPCRHACAGMSYSRHNPEDYVHRYYKRDAYIATYAHGISPINGQKLWEPTEDPTILPPLYKRGPGRPKKLRRRDPHEDTEERLNRGVARHRCSRCGQFGHNLRSCRNPVMNTDPLPSQQTQPVNPDPQPSQVINPDPESTQTVSSSYHNFVNMHIKSIYKIMLTFHIQFRFELKIYHLS